MEDISALSMVCVELLCTKMSGIDVLRLRKGLYTTPYRYHLGVLMMLNF